MIKGIPQEIVERLMARNASPGHLRDTIGFVHTLTPYHPEVYKVLACEMMQEAGAQLLLHTSVIDVATEGETITGVMVFYSQWKKADLPIQRDGLLFFSGPHEDELLVNVSRISGLDPTKAEHLTEAEIEGRKQEGNGTTNG